MQRHLKTLIAALADRLGYRIIPKWRLRNHKFAEHLAGLFSLLEIDLVFDVGANQGQYRDFLRNEVGFAGRIWSFEPIPELAAALQDRAKSDVDWRIFHTALGATPGELSLNVMHASDFSSFLAPTTEHTDRFREANAVARQVTVPVTTLDRVFAEHAAELGAAHIYLKMDTQGFDLEVLKGGAACLPGIAALQTEISITPLYQDMPGYVSVLHYLDGCDFSPSAFVPVGNAQSYKILELECCMVNNRLKPDIAD